MKIRIVRSPGGSPDELAAKALEYALRGIRVLPCRPKGLRAKSPYTRHGVKDATCDPGTLADWWERWPEALIGVAIPGDVLVIDIDPRNGGSREFLEMILGALPDTLTVTSGRNDGGTHNYYRRPAMPLRGKVPGVPGVDVLQNGYVIAPPSLHPNTGQPYRTSDTYDFRDLPDLPERAIAALARTDEGMSEKKFRRGGAVRARGAAWSPARMVGLFDTVRNAPKGERNDTLYWAAGRVVAECPSYAHEAAFRLLKRAALDAGLMPREIEATIASARVGRK